MADIAELELPSPHEETAHFYDDLSRYYHLIYHDWPAVVRHEAGVIDSLVRRFSSSFRSPGKHRVLDCTAGIGTQALGLWELGYDVTASDLSRQSLSMLHAHAGTFRRSGDGRQDIETRIEDCCALNRSFLPDSFDTVICMDNAVAHLIEPDDLTAAVQSMASVLSDQGTIVLSVRPYDELVQTRPTFHPQAPRFKSDRMYFQVWRWIDEEIYESHFFLILPDDRVLTWRTRFRAIRLREVLAALETIGFEAFVLAPEDSGYFQPVVVARRTR